jgi:hypothetical protein
LLRKRRNVEDKKPRQRLSKSMKNLTSKRKWRNRDLRSWKRREILKARITIEL